jgi:hypothetical protein
MIDFGPGDSIGPKNIAYRNAVCVCGDGVSLGVEKIYERRDCAEPEHEHTQHPEPHIFF